MAGRVLKWIRERVQTTKWRAKPLRTDVRTGKRDVVPYIQHCKDESYKDKESAGVCERECRDLQAMQ